MDSMPYAQHVLRMAGTKHYLAPPVSVPFCGHSEAGHARHLPPMSRKGCDTCTKPMDSRGTWDGARTKW